MTGRLRRRMATIAAGVAVVGGCQLTTERAAPVASSVTSRDSAGVAIVTSTGPDVPLPFQMTPRTLPSFRTAADSVQLTVILTAVRLSDGALVLIDVPSQRVVWLDEEGAHLRTLQQGDGPGEFRVPTELVVLPGDTLLVTDVAPSRHVFVSPSGEYLREERLNAEAMSRLGPWAECGVAVTLADGSRLLCSRLDGRQRPVELPDGRYRDTLRIERVSRDLLQRVPLGLYAGLEQWLVSAGQRRASSLHPFFSETFTAVGPRQEVAIATNPEYSVQIWDARGNLVRVIRRPEARVQPTPPQARAADSVALTYARGDARLEAVLRREVVAPDTIPAVQDLLLDAQSFLWVGRSPKRIGEPSTRYDVFSESGEYVGTTSFPGRFQLHEVGETFVLGVAYGEYDLPSIMLYDLVRHP